MAWKFGLEDFVRAGRVWNFDSQQEFANSVKPGSDAAWARELKTLFNLLGSAWVTSNNKIQFTDVGWELLQSSDIGPLKLLERQVRTYQLGNPQLSSRLTGNITIIPHYVLLRFLQYSYPTPISINEFILFVMKVQSHTEIPVFNNLLSLYRSLTDSTREWFRKTIDSNYFQTMGRVSSYAASFLTLPRYLKYAEGQISIANPDEVRRVLSWYDQGHNAHIAFESPKDWFSHYGGLDTTPNLLVAADYHRKMGNVEEAVVVYREALQKGIAPLNDSAEDYRCRIYGEAAIENWLIEHLERIESGLVFVDRQFETNSAGRIDILAQDKHDSYVVVELKRDKASDETLGQLLRYLGWVRLNLSQTKSVRGFVVGKDIDRHMGYAIQAHDALPEICNLVRYGDLGIQLKVKQTADGCCAWVEDHGKLT